mmetsp:Transcript_8812/g.16019  ORF Transcript_8812/g.16019 Transcript_8812/m.16019 type:complete len:297 (-) Transcript_8812:153-1043(-)|eukprot:CAMPEP_0198297962 /NCGR_PEP_ID=MMETSP1449-20131203/39088_1 /TAXON_ID=420275 /ORGANISM="Attheya septentrionalis, Strain CCMP2084" /LENGTH=296 /DNA_ID=CAMNT_0043999089 /DNA_START=57 /DNA_END=947 /DNA_ORIENTATION=-
MNMDKATALLKDARTKLGPKISVAKSFMKENAFLTLWSISGVLAVFIPVIHWNNMKRDFYKNYGYYIEYQNNNNQEEYENGGNNDDNNNNAYNRVYQSNGRYYYVPKTCHWWQIQCRQHQSSYIQTKTSKDDDQNGNLPSWFTFFGGASESELRFREENGYNNPRAGSLSFVYAVSLVWFITLLLWGGFVIYKKSPTLGMVATLLAVFAQFSIMMIVLLIQGPISTDSDELETNIFGWYGQLGVLMTYSNFWMALYCITFSGLIAAREYLTPQPSSDKGSVAIGDEKAQPMMKVEA